MKTETIFAVGLVLLLCAACAKQQLSRVEPDVGGEPFFVHLQEGFSGEPARVLVDGIVLFEGKPKTNPLLGIAHEFTGSAASTDITVTIEIPKKSIKSTHNVDLKNARGLGISVQNGKVTIVQANAFGYD